MRMTLPTRSTAQELLRALFWFCACNLMTALLPAQCTSQTTIPPGSYTTGDHSYTDANALVTSSTSPYFQISGSATATFSAANCINLAQGFSAQGSGSNIFQAWVNAGPRQFRFPQRAGPD